MLNSIVHGDPTERTPLLIAHGLFGSAKNLGVIAKRLSSVRQVIVVDMRNHANSAWAPSHRYQDMANDLAEIATEPFDVMGHSMGGKAAMALALTHPDRVRKLIVADIAPVHYSHTQQPMIDAMRSIDLTQVETRRDADVQLAQAIDDPGVRAFLLQSLDVRERKWRLNLDVLEAEMSLIMGFPDFDARYDRPTLFLSGADSDYVTPEHRPRIKTLFPTARFAKIPNAGHWLHADNPRAFEAAISAFLDR